MEIPEDSLTGRLRTAIKNSNLQEVAALIDAGADVHYQSKEGYDALINAAYGRDDSQLIEMLTLLVNSGASLTGKTSYNETAIRVLSRRGRFDAVEFLLNAGANPDDVKLTPLMEAVAFGTLADVQRIAEQGVNLEERDYWERTAWLFALQTGDVSKAQFLLGHGANSDARGRCGKPPLFYAIENNHPAMLQWLLELGIDANQRDDFGDTALMTAAEYDNKEAVDLLLPAGANVNQRKRGYGALSEANTRDIALRLLEAGADPQELSSEGRRAILGYPPEPDTELLAVSLEDFQQFRSRRFGTKNPELMNNPFWEGMIHSGLNAYRAAVSVEGERNFDLGHSPIWCAERFGQSLTFLEDGRIVQVGGEHEDHYDPDFCIYNDILVHGPDGSIIIYGYPEDVFPPTDFHTATLIGKYIYLIGSLGYQGTRRYGETPVYRLDTNTFQMECISTTGDNPGWIYQHRAVQTAARDIRITGGKVVMEAADKEDHMDNGTDYVLNTETLTWTAIASLRVGAPGRKLPEAARW